MATDSITTVARPYAKALFELALKEGTLDLWSKLLEAISFCSLDTQVQALVETPGIEAETIAQFFISVCEKYLNEQGKNLLRLLAENHRLQALPDIFVLYEKFKAEQEKTLDVDVKSFEDLDEAQKEALHKALKERLSREINLKVTIDKSLLGGAVIHAGSLVIDGSVKTKLENLNIGLQEA